MSPTLMVIFILCTICWRLAIAQRDREYIDGELRGMYKTGEFNDRCRSTHECRPFGYVCRDNRTCQCDYMYIPDHQRHSCVGGVNQRCVYDEHCIEGAFCMNQAVCRCKDTSPIELEDGLVCAGTDRRKVYLNWWQLIVLLTLFSQVNT